MTIDIFSEYKETRSNDRYDLYVDKGDDITIATTFLKPGKETLGHHHENIENYYFHHDCLLVIGGTMVDIVAPKKVTIPPNIHHQVINNSDAVVIFTCTYETIDETV